MLQVRADVTFLQFKEGEYEEAEIVVEGLFLVQSMVLFMHDYSPGESHATLTLLPITVAEQGLCSFRSYNGKERMKSFWRKRICTFVGYLLWWRPWYAV